MKTKITKLKRKDKTITLVGVCHIGSKKYYEKIQNVLDQFENGTVLYERVKIDTDDEKPIDYKRISNMFDLFDQKTEIKYKDDWIHSDLKLSTLESIHGDIVIEKDFFKDLLKSFNDMDQSEKDIIRKHFRFVFKFHSFLKLFIKSKIELVHKVRDGKVMIDCFELLKEKDNIAIFYGDNHCEYYYNFLKKLNFKKVDRYKLDPLEI